MTSSETRTEPSGGGAAPAPAATGWLSTYGGLLSGAVLLAAGWVVILHLHRWYVTPAVVMLWVGWLGVVLSARYAWRAGMAVAEVADDEEDEFWVPRGRTDELELEKRTLLKAIKEIEFDHGMGKMSDEDAAELVGYYRRRAIDVIKALEAEGGEAGGERPAKQSIAAQIERDVKARLAVDAAGARKRRAPMGGGAAGGESAATETKAGDESAATETKAGGQDAAATETTSDDADEAEASEARRAEESA